MLKRTVNHASDLEWLLRSQQVNKGTIVDFLVREYYSSIHNLASSSLTYPKHADRVTKEIFFRAVLQAKDYSGDSSTGDWLHPIVMEVLNKERDETKDQRALNTRLIKALLNQRSH